MTRRRQIHPTSLKIYFYNFFSRNIFSGHIFTWFVKYILNLIVWKKKHCLQTGEPPADMEWTGLEWNHGVEWSGMDFSGGCILVILGHFDTFGHFGSKFSRFC